MFFKVVNRQNLIFIKKEKWLIYLLSIDQKFLEVELLKDWINYILNINFK